MNNYEKIVCELFRVKDQGFISKQALIKSLAVLNQEYENVYVDLFEVCPEHGRFRNFTDKDKLAMRTKIDKKNKIVEFPSVVAPEPVEVSHGEE